MRRAPLLPNPSSRGAPSALLLVVAAVWSPLSASGAPAQRREAALTPIPAIQGHGAASPFAGRRVTTQGAVTRVDSDGFFLQDPAGDGDPRTSDALFVFTGTAPAIMAGDCVRVAGRVTEYDAGAGAGVGVGAGTVAGAGAGVRPGARTVTELHGVSAWQVLGHGCGVAPVEAPWPPRSDADFARFEGMLVTLRGPFTVQQNFFLGRFGQLTLASGGRLQAPTNRVAPGAAARTIAADNAHRSLLLDDGSARQHPAATPFLGADGTVRAGDTVPELTGVVARGPATAQADGRSSWILRPTRPPRFTRANPRTAVPAAVGGTLRIASANVDNFFSTVADGGARCAPSATPADCRGARSAAEFARQRAKLVAELGALDADVIALMEIENDGATTLQVLVDALNARPGAAPYARVDDPPEGTGHDAIKVALLYRPARLRPIGPARSDLDPVHDRAPLAQTFEQRRDAGDASPGPRFNLVASHFKSRRCDGAAGRDADQGDLQGCWNARRTAQARALARFAAALQRRSGVDETLLVGDFNAYPHEDPIALLARRATDAVPRAGASAARGGASDAGATGFIDQVERFEPGAYSFVFDGAAGRLDQVLASPSLAPRVTGVAVWHVDADEPALLDYTLAFRAPACAACAPDLYAPTPYRASDHDPVLVGLRLPP